MQSINLEKEKRSEKLLWVHGQTFPRVWSPSIFDNDEVSQVYGEEVRDFYKMDRGLLYDDDSDWGNHWRNGNDNIFIDGGIKSWHEQN